ncbi:MAG: monovalent cation/H+ antiporter complex subunit F [Meiothermus sp.]|uniref:monovalent cation/H+ antiporter complex subunit F n=1 Tax=Meiothermus sp. TaxID=1955249 RepID=UPI0025DD71A1|nr:monovalent cation/H+ antiporter complex subunit F [Meiothermus sp.]MCS7058451.1 monovalent cation/H+ antiporter complex subunit F [Meiothermus sp.]MCS7193415.1 monovalent cation/H+ antiporter complex subunit F [Meiothermus sp.]MCX7740333.1 monovalent cation/H+ antiporter complex subunit F [Meiothermus sp.]MDW8090928.1 monovalent cation/H+ antiporter complex subunit F [Meiothermus sp.]MDW8482067.1 monovalent cation/H+ antiporter complex subunit F [Meiothermus sp.]
MSFLEGALIALLLTLPFAVYRLVRGPTLPDRVVGLDLITTVSVALAALYALVSGQTAFLDVATALALFAFLATLGLARYIEYRGHRED